MTLGMRKLMVLGLIAVVFLIANVLLVAGWLAEKGVIDFARHIKAEYLTGTALTIVIVLMILLVKPGGEKTGFLRSCPVCDHTLICKGKYCCECESKI